jgi:hypothetical protein
MSPRGWLLLVVAVMICGAVYAPILTHDFVGWDDYSTIAANQRLLPPTASGIKYYWLNPAGGLYIPITYTVWSLLALIAQRSAGAGAIQLAPWAFHAASLFVHVLSTALVFDLIRRILRSDIAAMLGALVFSLHPLQVESVAWASGLKDLLCGVFTLIAIWCWWMRAAEKRGSGFYIASIVAVVLAMLSKPGGLMAPLIIAAIDLGIIRRPLRRVISQILPMVLLAIPVLVITRIEQTAPEHTYTPLWTRPLIALDSVSFYLRKLVLPINLAPAYGRAPQTVVATGEIYYTWIFVAIAAVGIVLARKRYPLLIVSSAIFVLGMLPVLGLTRFMYQRHSTVADHYMYLPMLGVALAVAEVTAVSRSRRVDAIVVMLIIVMGGVSLMQERYWRDSIALFSRAAQVTPEDAGTQGNLGRALAQAGRVGEAVPHFEKAVTLSPADVEEQISLARALLLSGDAAAAEPHLAEAVRLSPDDPRLAAELTALRARLRPPATNKGDIPAY